ncbi:MAG: RND transporter, partial [Henriciella sp.]
MRQAPFCAAALAGLLTLAGCATAPEPPAMSGVAVGAHFLAPGLEAVFDDSWWDQFDDPALSALIGQALAANKSLDVASANVRIAEA